MKPSTIILANTQRMGGSKDDAITAILNYLDEEWEKNKNNCEHKWKVSDSKLVCYKCDVVK